MRAREPWAAQGLISGPIVSSELSPSVSRIATVWIASRAPSIWTSRTDRASLHRAGPASAASAPIALRSRREIALEGGAVPGKRRAHALDEGGDLGCISQRDQVVVAPVLGAEYAVLEDERLGLGHKRALLQPVGRLVESSPEEFSGCLSIDSSAPR